jgi:hypothetical protein
MFGLSNAILWQSDGQALHFFDGAGFMRGSHLAHFLISSSWTLAYAGPAQALQLCSKTLRGKIQNFTDV